MISTNGSVCMHRILLGSYCTVTEIPKIGEVAALGRIIKRVNVLLMGVTEVGIAI